MTRTFGFSAALTVALLMLAPSASASTGAQADPLAIPSFDALLGGKDSLRSQVFSARQALRSAAPGAMAAALEGEDPYRAFAALSFEAEGRAKFSHEALMSVLEGPHPAFVANGAAYLLGRRRTRDSNVALVRHLEGGGRASETAVRFLAPSRAPAVRQALFRRASVVKSDDEAALLAVLAVATDPSEDVTRLLERLAADWSSKIQEAGLEAQRRRAAAGLEVKTKIKEVPTGLAVEDLLTDVQARKRGGEDVDVEALVEKARKEAEDQDDDDDDDGPKFVDERALLEARRAALLKKHGVREGSAEAAEFFDGMPEFQ